MEERGHSQETELSKGELQDLLLDPEISEVLQSVQVDLVALMELVNIAYEDAERQGDAMKFEKRLESAEGNRDMYNTYIMFNVIYIVFLFIIDDYHII